MVKILMFLSYFQSPRPSGQDAPRSNTRGAGGAGREEESGLLASLPASSHASLAPSFTPGRTGYHEEEAKGRREG